MSDTAKLIVDGKEYELPIITGTEGERALDISGLRGQTGLVTMDPGYKNTGSTTSAITFLDGEQGVLRYCGYPIEQLAEHSTFVETSYLLIYGKLPNATELADFSNGLTYHSMIHEDMRHFFDGFPAQGHPMAMLAAMVGSLSAYYPGSGDPDARHEGHVTRMLSKMRTIAAFGYKRRIGQPVIYPKNELSYCSNFLKSFYLAYGKPNSSPPPPIMPRLAPPTFE